VTKARTVKALLDYRPLFARDWSGGGPLWMSRRQPR